MLVLADISNPFSTVQVKSPECDNVMELIVVVNCVRYFNMEAVVDPIAVPSGSVHTTLIFTGTSTAEFNSTVQVRVGEDPDRMGLGVSEITFTTLLGTI